MISMDPATVPNQTDLATAWEGIREALSYHVYGQLTDYNSKIFNGRTFTVGPEAFGKPITHLPPKRNIPCKYCDETIGWEWTVIKCKESGKSVIIPPQFFHSCFSHPEKHDDLNVLYLDLFIQRS